MLQIALKCADICNPCRPWEVSRAWSDLQAAPLSIRAGREAVSAGERSVRDARLRYRAMVEPITEVLLVEREFSDPVRVAAGLLSSWLREEGASVLSSGTNLNNMSANTVHLAICLGGDGTLLEVRYTYVLCLLFVLYLPVTTIPF